MSPPGGDAYKGSRHPVEPHIPRMRKKSTSESTRDARRAAEHKLRKAERLATNYKVVEATAEARLMARDGWDVTPAGEIDGVPQFVYDRDGLRHANRVAFLSGDLEERFDERARIRSGAPKTAYYGKTAHYRKDR